MPYPAAHTYMYIDNICEYHPAPFAHSFPCLSLLITGRKTKAFSYPLHCTNGYRMLVRWYQSH